MLSDFELWLDTYFKDRSIQSHIRLHREDFGDLEDHMLETLMWLAYQAGYKRRVLQDQEDKLI